MTEKNVIRAMTAQCAAVMDDLSSGTDNVSLAGMDEFKSCEFGQNGLADQTRTQNFGFNSETDEHASEFEYASLPDDDQFMTPYPTVECEDDKLSLDGDTSVKGPEMPIFEVD